jgi:oxygen-dependent protoporphyrinogen oxidase
MARGPVVIFGAGLTGLSAAAALKRRGLAVTLLEASDFAGGAVGTEKENGFLVERGPNSMMVGDTEVTAFLRELGMENEIIGPQAKKRFLVRKGQPVALPSGPLGAVATPLFSLSGKLRVLGEPFVPRGEEEEESLGNLVRRRLGPEILSYAIEPFVAGIYAGDPGKLSAKHAFPKLWQLEQDHGSFVRGALRRRRTGPRQKMVSFRGGMGALVDRLADLLGEDLHCGAQLENIARRGDGWRVDWSINGRSESMECGSLVSAVPAFAVPHLPWSADLRAATAFLHRVEYPPVSVVALGFSRDSVRHPLDGFGMLVPAVEDRHILGTIFSSSLFPDRAPSGRVLLTTFVGGARQPELALLPDDEIERLVRNDLAALLGVEGTPVFRRVIRWPRAIPQYNLGYGEIVSALEKLEAAHPGLHFVGNYRGGIAAGQCIRNGLRLAEEIGARTT